jgi:hypothetical protein
MCSNFLYFCRRSLPTFDEATDLLRASPFPPADVTLALAKSNSDALRRVRICFMHQLFQHYFK